ncbi:MAG TPA: hypothetical protein VL382_02780, partial [Terriglobales bacterium]|nr:hypothetical protein [Terriglobales bacterium]
PHALNNHGAVAGGVGEAHGGNVSMFSGAATTVAATKRAASSDYAEAMGMNDAGTVVGARNGATSLEAFVWDRSQGMRTLAPLAGDNGASAAAINNAGTIAGMSAGPQGMRAVTWQGMTATALPSWSGADASTALAINDNGEISGWISLHNVKHAVLWSADGTIHDLGTLGGGSEALALNGTGGVAGLSVQNDQARAFAWSAASGMQSLGTLAGGTHSEAFGINDAGQIVGSSGSARGLRAFLWTGSAMVDLNTLIPNDANLVLMVAVAINEQGQILALGSRGHNLVTDPKATMDTHAHAGATQAFLLTPQ